MSRQCLAILVSILASACASAPGGSTPILAGAEVAYCEANFSVLPHKKAKNLVGEARLLSVWALRDSFESEQRFIESFDEILEQVLDLMVPQNEFDVETVYGGYRGFTSPSLSLKAALGGDVTRSSFADLSLAIGFVFVQESVLVSCTPEPGQEKLVPAFDLTESGKRDALNAGTLKKIYGMMIGEADGDLELGFSYYPNEDRFSVLGFAEGGDRDREILSSIASYLSNLSGDMHDVAFKERALAVSYPLNNWAKAPSGEAYQQALASPEIMPELISLQTRFIRELDDYVQAPDSELARKN